MVHWIFILAGFAFGFLVGACIIRYLAGRRTTSGIEGTIEKASKEVNKGDQIVR